MDRDFPYSKPNEEYRSKDYSRYFYKGYKIEIELQKEEDKFYWDLWITTPSGKTIYSPRHEDGRYYDLDEIKQIIDKKHSTESEIADKEFEESLNVFEKLYNSILLEDVDVEKSGSKSIKIRNQETGKTEVVDLTNFIYANTNGGTESFTIVGIRANDSKSDPSKKAGDEMVINGRMKYRYSGTGTQPLGNAKERYEKYDTLTVLVTSVDGVPYPPKSIRSFKVNSIKKIIMSGETYNIL